MYEQNASVSTTPNRWTTATLVPDMWVDPGGDPGNTDDTSLDGEAEVRLEFIPADRFNLHMKCADLDVEQSATDSEVAKHKELGTCIDGRTGQ